MTFFVMTTQPLRAWRKQPASIRRVFFSVHQCGNQGGYPSSRSPHWRCCEARRRRGRNRSRTWPCFFWVDNRSGGARWSIWRSWRGEQNHIFARPGWCRPWWVLRCFYYMKRHPPGKTFRIPPSLRPMPHSPGIKRTGRIERPSFEMFSRSTLLKTCHKINGQHLTAHNP